MHLQSTEHLPNLIPNSGAYGSGVQQGGKAPAVGALWARGWHALSLDQNIP